MPIDNFVKRTCVALLEVDHQLIVFVQILRQIQVPSSISTARVTSGSSESVSTEFVRICQPLGRMFSVCHEHIDSLGLDVVPPLFVYT